MRVPVYLDHAATTPVDPAVAQAMSRCLTADGTFANPSSSHAPGRAAAELVERARAQVAALIGAQPQEIVFTSGATESNNLALLGVARANADRGRHVVTSRIEHKSVLDPCRRLAKEGFEISYVPPDARGSIDPGAVERVLRPDTLVVSILQVHNEIGVIEDIAGIGALCRDRGIAFHTDAAQSAGRIAIDAGTLPVDYLSLTSHKIYGPKGVGALYVRCDARARLQPVLFGGGQEGGLRPGTLPTHQIVGFGAAAELAGVQREGDFARIRVLRDRLWAGLERLGGTILNGADAPRVPHILNVSFADVDGESLFTALAMLAVSTGSACSSAAGDASYVLRALGRGTRLAESSLRFSPGRHTTLEEIDFAVEAVGRQLGRLRRLSPGPARSVPPAAPPGQGDCGEAGAPGSGGDDVARLFGELPGGGMLAEGLEGVLRGEAGGPDEDVWVRFHLLVEGDTVRDARFQARGCPHTLATAAWLTSRLPGQRLEEVLQCDPRAWARALKVPVENLGRLLVIEDALRATLRSGPRLAHHE